MINGPESALRMSCTKRLEQSGAALLELSIVLAFFIIPVFFCIIEAGRLINSYKTLVHQVHHTARYLSVQEPGKNHEYAICLLKTGKLLSNCLDSDALLPGFNSKKKFDFTIEDLSTSSTKKQIPTGDLLYPVNVNVVTVAINTYPFEFLFLNFFDFPSINLGPVSSTYRQVN